LTRSQIGAPVSDATAAPESIRSTLARARPRDAVTGEFRPGHGPRRWVIDPIDGTKDFVRGVPVWATLIAARRRRSSRGWSRRRRCTAAGGQPAVRTYTGNNVAARLAVSG
jgi:fructose-1,6-bisphosphatase/inositol monophosphatase family enzyme